MNRSRRLLLTLLLSVSLDLATTVVPTPLGLQWDDEEEFVQLRRTAPAAQAADRDAPGAAQERRDATAQAYAARRPRAPARSPARVVPHVRADLSARDPASPVDDH